MLLASALTCMALNIYHEARGELIPGQYAVALVTWNRAHHDRRRVCATVKTPHQFSWTNGLLKNGRLIAAGEPKNRAAWRLAKRIAQVTMAGRMADITHGATHYHTPAVKPAWDRRMLRTLALGGHFFYRDITVNI